MKAKAKYIRLRVLSLKEDSLAAMKELASKRHPFSANVDEQNFIDEEKEYYKKHSDESQGGILFRC